MSNGTADYSMWFDATAVRGEHLTKVPEPEISTPQSAYTQPTLDKSPETQRQREAFIRKLIQKGIFAKVDVPGTLPRLWVTLAFHALDFETKEKFVSVVYAYYFDGSGYGDVVRIFDNTTGKEIGGYSTANLGLRMDY